MKIQNQTKRQTNKTKSQRVHGLHYVLVNSSCAGVLLWSVVGMQTTLLISIIKIIRVLSFMSSDQ